MGSLVSVRVTSAPTAAVSGREKDAVGGVGDTSISAAALKSSVEQAERTCRRIGSLLPRGGTLSTEGAVVVCASSPLIVQ